MNNCKPTFAHPVLLLEVSYPIVRRNIIQEHNLVDSPLKEAETVPNFYHNIMMNILVHDHCMNGMTDLVNQHNLSCSYSGQGS